MEDVPLLTAWRAGAGLQLLMMAGNISVGVGVLVLARYGLLAVALAVAAALGLHQRYEGRLRSHQEREAGQRHAAAVGRLTEDLDEPGVLQRAAQDACDLADADVVDIELPTHGGAAAVLHRHSRRGEQWTGDPTAAPGLSARMVAELPVPTGDGATPGRLRVWLASGAPDLRPGQFKEAALRSLAEHAGAAVRNARIHAQQTYHATHDRLTGLPARQLLIDRIERPLRAGKLSSHEPVALVVVDLLGFRKLARVFGPDVADGILSVTARRLQAAAEPGEYVAHIHADDFGIYLPAAGDPARVRARAVQLVAAAAVPMPLGASEITLEAAAGAVFSRTPVGSGSELLRQAGVALDSAIGAGLPVDFYDPAKDDVGSPAAVVMRSELHAALDEDQLFLLYQPIIHLPSGAPVAMEALARWNHPTKGLLPAAEFITVLENSPDHDRFVAWQLDAALRTRARWDADRNLPVSINLAARCLLDRRFPGRVATALERAVVPGHQLIVEIDEDDILTGSMGSVAGVLTELQMLGVQVAIDGFGAGDVRFFGLLQVPADYLKVDGYFVRQMFLDPQAMATVCVGLDLGRRVDLQVVAVGVNSDEHVTRLSQLGCTTAQGPHLVPPLHRDAIVGYLKTAPAAPDAPHDVVVPLDSRRRTPTC
ncbi:MAG: EAL domain-containing protein [Mycobacteriales bacterium]